MNSIKLNLSTNIFKFIVNIFLGIFLTPFLLKYIGAASFAIVQIAISFGLYGTMLTTALSTSISKYLVDDFHRSNIVSLKVTFATSFWSIILAIIILLPIIVLIVYFLPYIITINLSVLNAFKSLNEVRFLFGMVFISFFITSLGTIWGLPGFSRNSLWEINLIESVGIVVRVVIIVISFIFISASPIIVGIAMLGQSFLQYFSKFIVSKKYFPDISVNPKLFSIKKCKSLLNLSGWLIISQLGSLLFLQTDVIIVNNLIGENSAGQFSALMQWPRLIRTFANTLVAVITPIIFINIAKKQESKNESLILISIKVLGSFFALIVGCLCGFSNQLLEVWLGPEYRVYSTMLVFMVIHLPINLCVLPLFSLTTAIKKVKYLGLFTIITGIMHILTSIILIKYQINSIYVVIISNLFFLTVKNAIYLPILISRFSNIKIKSILFRFVYIFIELLIVIILTQIFSRYLLIDSLLNLLFIGILIAIIFSILSSILLYTKEERNRVKKIIIRK